MGISSNIAALYISGTRTRTIGGYVSQINRLSALAADHGYSTLMFYERGCLSENPVDRFVEFDELVRAGVEGRFECIVVDSLRVISESRTEARKIVEHCFTNRGIHFLSRKDGIREHGIVYGIEPVEDFLEWYGVFSGLRRENGGATRG